MELPLPRECLPPSRPSTPPHCPLKVTCHFLASAGCPHTVFGKP